MKAAHSWTALSSLVLPMLAFLIALGIGFAAGPSDKTSSPNNETTGETAGSSNETNGNGETAGNKNPSEQPAGGE